MPSPRPSVRVLAGMAGVVAAALLATSCGGGTSGHTASGSTGTARPAPAVAEHDTGASHDPLPWGPTPAELTRAHSIVAAMSPDELAGQVIVGRWKGTRPATAARMVEHLHLAGVQITEDNIVDREQVRATTAAVAAASARAGRAYPPVIGVDQEGGEVAHLRGIAADLPPFATAGKVVARKGDAGRRIVRAAMRAEGFELRQLGFTWVFAPDADVTIGAADVTIGSRSPSSDPHVAAAAVAAAVEGYDDAGVVSTPKHFPGHGSATQDSHETLPKIHASRARLASRDLVPFRAAVQAGAPAVMVGHLDVTSLAPGVPTSLAPRAYDLLRDDLGFQGVAITDALGMGAVVSLAHPAVSALAAGADLLLMPADTPLTHQVLTRAIRDGQLSRARVEEAASRVVAVQLWQQRMSLERPVPHDASARAEHAARRLLAGGS